MPEYSDLFSLLQNDSEAKRYYSFLPEHLKETISHQPLNIRSMQNLRDYAETLTWDDE